MPGVTDPLILPEDIVFSPVDEFPAETRERIGSEEGDVAVSRPRSRTPSKVVSREAADLLRLFRESKTIAEAVVEFSRKSSADPDEILAESFPILQDFVNDQFLLPIGSSSGEAIESGLEPGDRLGPFTVVCRVQTLVDTEIYQARADDGSRVAIKITREQAGPRAVSMLAHEARILRKIGGEITPELFGIDVLEERRAYLALRWCEGTPVGAMSAELREARDGDQRPQLLQLCAGVLEAYAELHARGVVHGDIHPGNVLVDSDDRVWLIDFGLARSMDEDEDGSARPPGGVAFFLPPEYAEAVRRGVRPPAPTPRSEQYALAALLYHVITGAYTHDFSLEREAMLRQIAQEPPVPFTRQAASGLIGVEGVLFRALDKRPGERFGSVAELAEELRRAAALDTSRPVVREPGVRPAAGAPPVDTWLQGVIDRCGWEGGLLESGLPRAPRASFNYGATGIGWLFYRLGRLRDDAASMALADVWVDRARLKLDTEDGFYNEEIDITPATVGRISPYHTPSGVHMMNALVADATGDGGTCERSLEAFVEAAGEESGEVDLTLGRSGIALAAAILCRTIGDPGPLERTGVLDLGREAVALVWDRLDGLAPVEEAGEVDYLGVAHGWAGFLYATAAWSLATGEPPPAGLERRLDELADAAELVGRGARWAWRRDRAGHGYMPGWCNGTAGYVFLWTLAHRLTGNGRWLRLAEKAAWNCWEDPARPASLCCGLAGRAYALLNWYKLSGEAVWVERARRLAETAVESLPGELHGGDGAGFENSLYKGEVGLATLLVDLERSDSSVMPFFEAEEWA